MEESLTQGDITTAASQEPTVTANIEPTADVNQETISNTSAEVNEEVSTATAQTQSSGGEDDGLAKFAKGQGIDNIGSMTERELKLLKIAHDNQKAYRKTNDKKLTDQVVEIVDIPKKDETEDESFKREFRQYKYEKQVDSFWSPDEKGNKKDRSLEPTMAKILNDKKAELTPLIGEDEAKKYCFNLSRDLNTLYVQAQIETGTYNPEAAKEEARREERDSIKKKIAAAPEGAHAVQSSMSSKPKITMDWIRNEYNSKNPDHVKMVNEFFSSKK